MMTLAGLFDVVHQQNVEINRHLSTGTDLFIDVIKFTVVVFFILVV